MFAVFVGVVGAVVRWFIGVIVGFGVLNVVLAIITVSLRGCLILGKVRLFVSVRKQGCRVESVPLRRLVLLSTYRKRRWSFVDGWLVLEAF
jgi:fluoride ion exporter CrcB/FEX